MRKAYQFAYSLVIEYQYNFSISINDIPEMEKENFAAILLEEDDRDAYFLNEDKNDNVPCALIRMLNQNSNESQQDFADSVRHKVVNYYEPQMDELLCEALGEYVSEYAEDHGLEIRHHKDNNDIYLVRH
jgi:hypothetical protein